MKLVAIQVDCYAGAEADPEPAGPRRFTVEGQAVRIRGGARPMVPGRKQTGWPRADFFKVRAVDQREFLLKHDLEADEWFPGQQW